MVEVTGAFALVPLLHLSLLSTTVKISSLDVSRSGSSALRDSRYDQLYNWLSLKITESAFCLTAHLETEIFFSAICGYGMMCPSLMWSLKKLISSSPIFIFYLDNAKPCLYVSSLNLKRCWACSSSLLLKIKSSSMYTRKIFEIGLYTSFILC